MNQVQPLPGTALSTWQRATAFERGVYPALIAWLRHRPDRGPHPQDSTLHPYVGVVATTMWVWIGASVLEVFAVHFLLPWPLARWIPLIITSGG